MQVVARHGRALAHASAGLRADRAVAAAAVAADGNALEHAVEAWTRRGP